jgi:F-type H+-transporting ATPase subunit b
LNSSVPQEEPKKKAQSLLDALPGNSLVSKTAILSAGTGVSIAAISNELYVVNEETVVAFSLLTIFWAVAHYGGPAYNSFAASQKEKMAGILNAARENHTSSVQQRIESVGELSGVIDITKTLFEVSKVAT